MNKSIAVIIAIAVVGLTSCSKNDYMYNHCYTFDKTKFGVGSRPFTVDHELSKQEQVNWCYEMDKRLIETLNQNPSNNYKLEDIDTSYVYLVRN
jgi:hypothetical protein